MLKRTIDISEGPTHLSVQYDQLILAHNRETIASIPCEDIGILLVDHASTTYSHAALIRLLHYGAAVVLCGDNHLPAGLIVGMENNDLAGHRIRAQARVKLPVRKRLWRQIVRHKVRLQARNLPRDSAPRRRLVEMLTEIRSGDRSNVEGRAAAIYWPALLGKEFRRDPDGSPPNNFLNYGYTVFRAACARAIVAAGLHPALSLQHHHRNNAFALADDLVELFRPLVDRTVIDLPRTENLDRTTKAPLLNLLTHPVRLADQTGPLMVQLHRLAASLVRCLTGEDQRLLLPVYSLQPAPAVANSRPTEQSSSIPPPKNERNEVNP